MQTWLWTMSGTEVKLGGGSNSGGQSAVPQSSDKEMGLGTLRSSVVGPDLTTLAGINPTTPGVAGFVPAGREPAVLVPDVTETAGNLPGVRRRSVLGLDMRRDCIRDSERLKLHLLDVKEHQSIPFDLDTPMVEVETPTTELTDDSGRANFGDSDDDDSSVVASVDRPRSYCHAR